MIDMGPLLEEQILPIDAECIRQNKEMARKHYHHPERPCKVYTIEYLHAHTPKKWACIAHDFYWKDRHKVFYCEDAGGVRHEVAEFYCDAKHFISQKARRFNPR